jgi:hypothetical protein
MVSVSLSFDVKFDGEQRAVVVMPQVNGTPLNDLAASFEADRGWDVAGGYGGLIPDFFKYGDLGRYFLGDFDEGDYFSNLGQVYVLGCQCGEVGCWPLLCEVVASPETVAWTDFRQPFRPERSYVGFGPFVFARAQYDEAVADLLNALERAGVGRP